MKWKLPNEFAAFVTKDLGNWINRTKPKRPKHYKANWTWEDIENKPSNWKEQEEEYNKQ